jgi:hypothetical protein
MDELIRDRVKVEWVRLGEGYWGDYDENNPNDTELLRFDVSWMDEGGEWIDPGDVSYCTLFPASATPEQMQKGLEILMNAFYDPMMDGYPCKKLGEEMSWISLEWLK